MRCGFHHRQRRQERLRVVPRCSGLEGTAPGRGRGSRYGNLTDVLGSGSDA